MHIICWTFYTIGLTYIWCKYRGQLSWSSKFFTLSFFAAYSVKIIALCSTRIIVDSHEIIELSEINMITLIFDLCYASNAYLVFVFGYVLKRTYLSIWRLTSRVKPMMSIKSNLPRQRNRSRNSKENSEVNLVEINGSEILGSSLAKETHHNKRKHAEGVKSFISKILDSFH